MKDLIDLAVTARESAYAPYSNHPVGAAILTESGELFSGCNVENAAYPEGVCAEASAISAMILAGGKQIVTVVIAGPGEHSCTPCGGCRQKIREFSTNATEVHVVTRSGVVTNFKFADLLPESFGPDCLDVNIR